MVKISTEGENQLSVTIMIRNELNSDVSSYLYNCEVETEMLLTSCTLCL